MAAMGSGGVVSNPNVVVDDERTNVKSLSQGEGNTSGTSSTLLERSQKQKKSYSGGFVRLLKVRMQGSYCKNNHRKLHEAQRTGLGTTRLASLCQTQNNKGTLDFVEARKRREGDSVL